MKYFANRKSNTKMFLCCLLFMACVDTNLKRFILKLLFQVKSYKKNKKKNLKIFSVVSFFLLPQDPNGYGAVDKRSDATCSCCIKRRQDVNTEFNLTFAKMRYWKMNLMCHMADFG